MGKIHVDGAYPLKTVRSMRVKDTGPLRSDRPSALGFAAQSSLNVRFLKSPFRLHRLLRVALSQSAVDGRRTIDAIRLCH
jgi:hypothetical protein